MKVEEEKLDLSQGPGEHNPYPNPLSPHTTNVELKLELDDEAQVQLGWVDADAESDDLANMMDSDTDSEVSWGTRKRKNREATFAAPATPSGAPVSQHLADIPSPFPKAKKYKPIPKNYDICGVCDKRICPASPSVAMRGQGCDRCGIVYHLNCVGLRFKPKYGSWACQGCLRAEETVVTEDEQ